MSCTDLACPTTAISLRALYGKFSTDVRVVLYQGWVELLYLHGDGTNTWYDAYAPAHTTCPVLTYAYSGTKIPAGFSYARGHTVIASRAVLMCHMGYF
eukprot:1741828-Rhodomonas_salina.2